MITEDYVSFEIAKLLKEKGFDEPCSHIYRNDGMHLYCGDAKLTTLTNTEIDEPQDWVSETFTCACPTLQMAMKWLREVYGLFIRITEDITGNIFEWSVYQKNYGCKASTYVEDSYEKACEVAIKYCLEHLIQ